MNAIKPTIPPSLEGFAKAAAALAESHGIKEFEMKVQLNFADEKLVDPKVDWEGGIRVTFRAQDGRGRPNQNLRINYMAKMEAVVISSPESFS